MALSRNSLPSPYPKIEGTNHKRAPHSITTLIPGNEGATLRMAHLGSKFKEVLQVTRLLTVFETYDSEAAAIESFGK